MILKTLLNGNTSKYILVIIDSSVLTISLYLVSLIFDDIYKYPFLNSSLFYISSSIFFLYVFQGYSFFTRYTSIDDLFKILIGIFVSNLSLLIFIGFTKDNLIVIFMNLVISLFLISSYRLAVKFYHQKMFVNHENISKVLIFGCGNSGILTKRALYNNYEYKVVGFADDDKLKWNAKVDGVKVFGLNKDLKNFIKKNKVDRVIITTTKISSLRLKYIYNYFNKLGLQVLKVPPVNTWINGFPSVTNLKKIKIEDLLGRKQIEINLKRNKKQYNNKTLLVTGAAGSIGSEIIVQLLRFEPKKIILIDNSETPMFSLREKLLVIKKNVELIFHICSVTNEKEIDKIFNENSVDLVFHAADYKHVGMMENNPSSAVINNLFGTKVILDNSIKYKVQKFILISSDKAVNPTNVMGATKRLCELYVSSKLNSNTVVSSTRFGNVLGSNGSVVPIFSSQIDEGGPVKVTHPDIVRYFMTIKEATQLVLEAGAMSKGGEVYVFDMGEPVKIVDLAKKMINQSGKNINIVFTGLRPGEKLFEEILIESEGLLSTHNKLIFISKKESVNSEFNELISELISLAFNCEDEFDIVKKIKEIIPEYRSNKSKFQKLDK